MPGGRGPAGRGGPEVGGAKEKDPTGGGNPQGVPGGKGGKAGTGKKDPPGSWPLN
jgi:hypothetical protein